MLQEYHRFTHNRTSRRVEIDPETGSSQPIAGIRAAESMARNAGNAATNWGAQYGQEGESIGSMLVPELEKEAFHPKGFDPADLNSMLVAGQQGAGGTNAAIQGEAGLRAARTRNTGSLSSVLDEAARAKSRANSESALQVQGENAALKERQRQAGLAGLAGQRGLDVKSSIEEQGLVPEDIKAWTDASKSGWLQNTLGVLDTISGMGKSAASLGLKIP